MKYIIAISIVLLTHIQLSAQLKATTEHGERVILKEDGTWDYIVLASENLSSEIPENPTPIHKSPDQNMLIKSRRINVGVYIDSKNWTFDKKASSEDQEYVFSNDKKGIHTMLIPESESLDIDLLRKVVMQNLEKVSTDIKITKEEYRTVNGIKVLCMEYEANYQGLEVVYVGYYYSSNDITVQLTSFTSKSLFKENYNDMVSILNGFVLTDKK